jgi:hypothetical protein
MRYAWGPRLAGALAWLVAAVAAWPLPVERYLLWVAAVVLSVWLYGRAALIEDARRAAARPEEPPWRG